MSRSLAAFFPVLTLGVVAGALGADSNSPSASPSKPTYAYATNGVLDGITDRGGDQWKLLKP